MKPSADREIHFLETRAMLHDHNPVSRRFPRVAFAGTLALAVLTGVACGQCPEGWSAGDPLPGVDGFVYAMTTWDPDGKGPQPEILIAAGRFSVAGHALANNIAAWDGSDWHALGDGVWGGDYSRASALAVMNGVLVAGGSFTSAGGVPASNIAMWNGSNWQPLSDGVNDHVAALLVFEGDLIAAGSFTFAGDVAANRIARWDGAEWNPLSVGTDGPIAALAEYDGDLIAGGGFAAAGGLPAHRAARWDGDAWHAMNLLFVMSITDLIVHDGVLIAAALGSWGFCMDDPCSGYTGGVHQWDGDDWQPTNWDNAVAIALGVHLGQLLVSYSTFTCDYQCSHYGGIRVRQGDRWQEFAGTWFTIAFAEFNGELIMSNGGEVVAWNGTEIHALGETGKRLWGLAAHAGAVVAGYQTNSTIGQQHGVAWWTGNQWQPLDGGFDGLVSTATTWNGDLIVGGDFDTIDGAPARKIARRDASGTWHSLGDEVDQCGMGGCHGSVMDLIEYKGDLIAAGWFTFSGTTFVRAVARWDGTQWHPMNLNTTVTSLAIFEGDLFAAGYFIDVNGVTVNRIARWDGAQWVGLEGGGVTLDDPSFHAAIFDLMVWDGRLIAAGQFDTAGGAPARNIAAWDGRDWSALGDGLGGAPGDYLVGGSLTTLAGDLVVGGRFSTAGGVPARNLARFDGEGWHEIDGGVNGEVRNVLAHGNRLFVNGAFAVAGNQASPTGWAVWGPVCPAGDITGDGAVNINDLLAVISAWGPCLPFPAECPADIVSNSHIDIEDLLTVILAWGA